MEQQILIPNIKNLKEKLSVNKGKLNVEVKFECELEPQEISDIVTMSRSGCYVIIASKQLPLPEDGKGVLTEADKVAVLAGSGDTEGGAVEAHDESQVTKKDKKK